MTNAPESRRHNRYRIDMTGAPADLDRAMVALNAHASLLRAIERVLAANDARDFDAEREAIEDLRAAAELRQDSDQKRS